MVTRLQRPSPLVIAALVVLGGAAAGFVAAPRAHSLDPFAVVVLGMAAAAVLATCLAMLEPAWILTAGLMLSLFSGNWGNAGVPIPLDRVVIICGIGSALVRSLRNRGQKRIQVRGLHWLMLLLILYAVGSAAWSGTLTSHGPLFALLDRLGVMPFLLYLVAPVAFRDAHQRRILAIGLMIIGAYLGLITLFEAAGLRSVVIPHYILNPALGIHNERARGPFLEAGANGLSMFICLVAAALTFSWWRDRRMRAAVVFVIVLCTAGILFTLTRQTWVGAGAGTVVAMLANRRLRGWLPVVGAAAAIIVVLSFVVIPGLSTNVSSRASSQGPIWDRLNSDAAALRMVEARPALGFGWGRFGPASGPYYRLAATYPLSSVGQVHNVLLSNASELGILGLALWLVILVVGLGTPAIRRSTTDGERWRLGLIAIIVAWFVQANLAPLDYSFPNAVLWLWAGVAVSVAAKPAGVRRVGSSRGFAAMGRTRLSAAVTASDSEREEVPVTVVIPAYNRAELLPRAIASIAAQVSYRPREVIVVDDASDDDTAAVGEALGVRVVRHEVNLGPAAARNTGFAAADSPWVMQMDSDDEWLPHCLMTLWDLRHGHVLVSGGSIGESQTGKPWYNGAQGSKPRLLKSPADLAFPDNFVASSAVLLKASCVRLVGGYRTDLRYAEDLELWLRMLEVGTGAASPIVVTRYHNHPMQSTAVSGEVHAGHARVLAMSIDRAWCSPSLAVRWSAVPHWDGLRRAYTDRQPAAVLHHAIKLVGHPQRLRGLAAILSYRVMGRRRSAGMTLEGAPTVALLHGAETVPGPADVDLRSRSLPSALLRLAMNPTESAIVGRRWHIPLVAMLGVRANVNESEESPSEHVENPR